MRGLIVLLLLGTCVPSFLFAQGRKQEQKSDIVAISGFYSPVADFSHKRSDVENAELVISESRDKTCPAWRISVRTIEWSETEKWIFRPHRGAHGLRLVFSIVF